MYNENENIMNTNNGGNGNHGNYDGNMNHGAQNQNMSYENINHDAQNQNTAYENMNHDAQNQNTTYENINHDAQNQNTAYGNMNNDSSSQNTIYRYDRQYYETHRDENTAYHYNETGNGSNAGTAETNANASYAYSQPDGAYDNGTGEAQMDKKSAKKQAKNLKKEQKRARKKQRNFSTANFARGAAMLVLVSAVAVGSTYVSLKVFKDESEHVVIQSTNTGRESEAKVTTVSSSNSVITTDVTGVVKEVMPSVVTISNIGTERVSGFFGQDFTQQYESSGSGIIVGQSDTELLIVTNQHVISGADTLNVTFCDDETYTADVKGSDSQRDIAVIAISLDSIKEDTLGQIKVATLGNSGNLAVGEPAIAIGNALGYGQSVTTGVISAVNREVSVDDSTNTLIQTDAAINPGNSGGALLNIKGEVIGINSVKYASTEVEGMGYAIPISDVTDIINEMMNGVTKKKVEDGKSGYLGIRAVDVNSSVSATYNMPEGVYVAQVDEDSTAEKAGIKKGDIITKLDNTTISSSNDLTTELQYHEAGSIVKIVVQSPVKNGYGYEEKTLEVTLDRQQD